MNQRNPAVEPANAAEMVAATIRLSESPPEEIRAKRITVVADAVMVVHPAASPSSPSVRFTAFETEMMTTAAQGIYSQSIDSGSHPDKDSRELEGPIRKKKRKTAAFAELSVLFLLLWL